LNIEAVTRKILRGIKTDLGDEFDKNFEREAFFSQAWARRRSPVKGKRSGHLLVDTGALRRSVKSRIDGDSVVFYSDLPYASIHNAGGEIMVTRRMKKYFWARYYAAQGAFGRRKNGALRKDKRNQRLTTEAEFWKAMALMRAGSRIRIPKRQFVGYSPEVEALVRDIIERNLDEYFKDYDFNLKMK